MDDSDLFGGADPAGSTTGGPEGSEGAEGPAVTEDSGRPGTGDPGTGRSETGRSETGGPDTGSDTGLAVTGPPSGRVRIFGAEPATGDVPVGRAPGDTAAGGAGDSPGSPDSAGPEPLPLVGSEPELPHWTEAPTGEVPSVVARDRAPDEDVWASVPAPVWREGHSDWDANEEGFTPAMLASDELTISIRQDSLTKDLQPWEFEIPAGEALAGQSSGLGSGDAGSDEAGTMVIPVVTGSGQGAEGEGAAEAGGPDAPAGPGGGPRSGRGEGQGRDPFFLDGTDDDFSVLQGDDPLVAGATGIAPPDQARRAQRRARRPRPVPAAPQAQPADGGRATSRPVASGRALTGAGTGAAAAVAASPAGSGARPVPPAPAPSKAPPGSGLTAVRSRPAGRPGQGPDHNGHSPAKGPGRRNLPAAIAVGLVLGLAVVVAFHFGTVLAMVVITVVAFLASVEAYSAFRRAGYQPAVLLGWVGTVSLMIATYNKGFVALPLILVLMFALTMIWYMAGVEPGADPVRGTASTLFVFCWIGVFGSFGALLLNPTLFPDRHGIAFLFGAILITVVYDVVALLVGSAFGRHQMAPRISPGKTWEGAVAGGAAAILVGAVIVRFIHPFTPAAAATLGLVVAVVAPLGDLCESVVKRQLGLKDMGRLLPGHGGILDRVDAMLFVLPATYYLVKAFHLG